MRSRNKMSQRGWILLKIKRRIVSGVVILIMLLGLVGIAGVQLPSEWVSIFLLIFP